MRGRNKVLLLYANPQGRFYVRKQSVSCLDHHYILIRGYRFEISISVLPVGVILHCVPGSRIIRCPVALCFPVGGCDDFPKPVPQGNTLIHRDFVGKMFVVEWPDTNSSQRISTIPLIHALPLDDCLSRRNGTLKFTITHRTLFIIHRVQGAYRSDTEQYRQSPDEEN